MESTQISKETGTTRNFWIDILKIISIIMVVFFHTTDAIKITNIAVPIFLVITGFNLAQSITIRGHESFKTYYSPAVLWKRINRFLLPYLIFVICEIIALACENRLSFSMLANFILGGYGPGSYYTPLVFQILLFFPFIFYLLKRHKSCIFLFFFISFGFEVLVNLFLPQTNLVIQIYRIGIFRQIFYIASGCYMFLYKGKLEDIAAIIFAIIGATYYILFAAGLYTPIIFKLWIGTTIPFGLLAIAIVYLCAAKKPLHLDFKSARIFSNATYHIFLVQQIYYWLISNHDVYLATINILVCCVIGILFYMAEHIIIKAIKNRRIKIEHTTNL